MTEATDVTDGMDVVPQQGDDLEEPKSKGQAKRRITQQAETREDRLQRMLKNVLDNTPPDATPRSVRQAAEELLRG